MAQGHDAKGSRKQTQQEEEQGPGGKCSLQGHAPVGHLDASKNVLDTPRCLSRQSSGQSKLTIAVTECSVQR